jgi:beta-xylosidase
MTIKTADLRMRDPFILEPSPDSFVLIGTTDENLWAGPATGFDCYTSTDLENWEGPIPAFRPPSDFWSDTQFWAPEVHAYGGRYFLFATFASTAEGAGPRGVAVLVSDNATGPFVPWSNGPLTPRDVPCLDGTLFVDERSQPWLVYSRGAEGVPGGAPGISDGEMWALRLSSDLRSSEGAPVLLFTASNAPWSKPLRFPDGVERPEALNLGEDPLFTDGPFLFCTHERDLLMLWSSFGEEGYAMGIARSESGDVRGPWTQDEQPLWARNGGHGMIVTTTRGETKLVFHCPNETPDERVKLVEVSITSGEVRLVS